jgi:hypothetical protein
VRERCADGTVARGYLTSRWSTLEPPCGGELFLDEHELPQPDGAG